jgi:hypothetical protein
MKSNYIVMLIIAFAGLFSACQKETKCDDSLKAIVSSNGPVVAGDTLRLSVSGIDNVALYKWSGPNGFSSHEQNPVIPDIMSYYSGVYTVDVITEDGCIYRTLTDSIQVTGAQSSCDLQPNTALFRGALWNVYSRSSEKTNLTYTMYVDSYNAGSMTFEFRVTNAIMASGVYRVTEPSGEFSTGSVKVNVYGTSQWYGANGGKVYVSLTDGKITLSYCDITFKSGDVLNATTTGSLLVSE